MQVVKLCFLFLIQLFFGLAMSDRVRIHVPTKIKTVYQTKFVKVPEHHHYFHEKVKEVPKFVTIHKDHDSSSLLGAGY
ncbi:hypothetical protein RN001_015102 [Aquatica leii]|uniref:Uncharacterized protein n=1 Tax=Aquatica leii TaxID=1421715 RepID=A0AAN7SKY7_9COLE|nr:hypothetical protein RN001_015102 [Aquatica leii]